MHPESEEIKQESNVDKYASRPLILKNMCSADYISLTDTIYNATNYKMQSEDETSVDENTSDEEGPDKIINDNDIIKLKKYFSIKSQNK